MPQGAVSLPREANGFPYRIAAISTVPAITKLGIFGPHEMIVKGGRISLVPGPNLRAAAATSNAADTICKLSSSKRATSAPSDEKQRLSMYAARHSFSLPSSNCALTRMKAEASYAASLRSQRKSFLVAGKERYVRRIRKRCSSACTKLASVYQ